MVTRGKSKTLLAYLAGIVDADGHVALHAGRKLSPEQRRISTRYQGEIVVTNTDRPLIDLLVETFGGHVFTRKKVEAHHKTTYSWKATDWVAVEVAKALLPYLFVKKGQAEIIIEFYEQRGVTPTRWRRPGEAEELARRDDCYARLRALVDDRRPQRLNERAPDLIG